VPWDVLRVGRFKSWTFSEGTFLEWDISRAGPFVCTPSRQYFRHRSKVHVNANNIKDFRKKGKSCLHRMIQKYQFRGEPNQPT
jgi:hypothetical protein